MIYQSLSATKIEYYPLENEMNIDLIIKRDKRIKRGNIIIRDILVKENKRCI